MIQEIEMESVPNLNKIVLTPRKVPYGWLVLGSIVVNGKGWIHNL